MHFLPISLLPLALSLMCHGPSMLSAVEAVAGTLAAGTAEDTPGLVVAIVVVTAIGGAERWPFVATAGEQLQLAEPLITEADITAARIHTTTRRIRSIILTDAGPTGELTTEALGPIGVALITEALGCPTTGVVTEAAGAGVKTRGFRKQGPLCNTLCINGRLENRCGATALHFLDLNQPSLRFCFQTSGSFERAIQQVSVYI
jgi:hypothetical protein